MTRTKISMPQRLNVPSIQHDQVNGELLEEQLRFAGLCNQAVAGLGELVTLLLVSPRAELVLSFDADAYARIIKEVQGSVLRPTWIRSSRS